MPLPTHVESRDEQATLLTRLLGNSCWCADRIRYEDGVLDVSGWALPVAGRRGAIAVNGRHAIVHEWAMHRPDIERLFWFWPDAANSGFTVRVEASPDDLFATGHCTLEYVDIETGRPFNARHGWFYPDPRTCVLPLPDEPRQARVQGVGDDGIFLLEGYSAFEKICAILEHHAGRPRAKFGSVLDWGCGCGRLTRHFAGMRRTRVAGVDIDADNIAWCGENLHFATFSVAPLRPPCTSLRSRQFDVVIGMSVMTHLTEADQYRWLDELARVTRRGALLALTVHGGATVARADFPLETLNQWLRDGFLDGGVNPDLINAIDEPEFYRNSFHTRDYIAREWTKNFAIVEHVEGLVGNHHDLVVLQRR